MSDAVNTAIPLALHPETLKAIGDEYQDDPVVTTLRDALSTARASHEATLTGHRKILADPTQTPAANWQRSATAAARRQEEALRRLDSALDRARRELDTINEAVNRVPDPPAPHVTRMIAESLRTMGPKERRAAIAEALQAGDGAVIGAVCYIGPAFAYGLSREERYMLRLQHQQAAYPAALARREALENAVDLVKLGGQALILAHTKMYDQHQLDHAAALARAASDAMGD